MNQILSVDLWVPGLPLGADGVADPTVYIAWVRPRPESPEQAPRVALHLAGCRKRLAGVGVVPRPPRAERRRTPRPRALPTHPREAAPRFANRERPTARRAKGTTLAELLEEW